MKKIYLFLMLFFAKIQVLLAMAPPAKDGRPQQGSGLSGMMMLFLPLLVIWYFLLIRPQRNKEKKKQRMINELTKGDKIMTIGGLYGQIVQVKDNRIIIKVSDKTNVEISKTAISGKVN